MSPLEPTQPAAKAPQDATLVGRMATGDATALSELYDRHSQAVYSHAVHLLGDAADGEDAVEETFRRAWVRADSYGTGSPDVPTWLLMICRQRVTERLRARGRTIDQDVLEDTTGLAPSDAPSETDAAPARIAAALASIPADQRTVLELAFFRGMAPAEVARATKQSPETTRTRLRVAMRKLRDALSEAASSAPAAPTEEGA